MTTLADLCDDVYTITARPDLALETKLALRQSIRKLHGAELFKRDLARVRIDMSKQTPEIPNSGRWALDRALFPNLRRIKAVNYPVGLTIPSPAFPAPVRDSTSLFPNAREFKELTPDNLFDQYGYERDNYFYISGHVVNVKSNWIVDLLDFTYYKWPVIPSALTQPIDSWIVDEYPEGIINDAAGAVFKMIGKDEEFARFNMLFEQALAIIKSSDIGEAL